LTDCSITFFEAVYVVVWFLIRDENVSVASGCRFIVYGNANPEFTRLSDSRHNQVQLEICYKVFICRCVVDVVRG